MMHASTDLYRHAETAYRAVISTDAPSSAMYELADWLLAQVITVGDGLTLDDVQALELRRDVLRTHRRVTERQVARELFATIDPDIDIDGGQ